MLHIIAPTCFGIQKTIFREHNSWFQTWHYLLPEDGVLKAGKYRSDIYYMHEKYVHLVGTIN
jgi:hypothetical protein